MHKSISSLALLKVSWDKFRKDYLENFVPFVVLLFEGGKIETVDADNLTDLCNLFRSEWGLIIPPLPMKAILNRVRKRGFIERRQRNYYPVMDKIVSSNFSSLSHSQEVEFESILDSFISHCGSCFSLTLSRAEAESAFINYLKHNDTSILFATHYESILPEVEKNKKHHYLVSHFVNYVSETDKDKLETISNIAIGHLIASAILYDEEGFKHNLKHVAIYLDTKIILRYLGVEGNANENIYHDFISMLKNEGATIKVFSHTYDEAVGILETCLRYINSTSLDPDKAGLALLYFIMNNCTESDIEQYINKLISFPDTDNILREEKPDPDKDREYQIDEEDLYLTIVENYTHDNITFDPEAKDHTLRLDVDSISSIIKLRQGRFPVDIVTL